MKGDLEISQSIDMRPIADIATDIGILDDEVHPFGRYKAKISLSLLDRMKDRKDGKLVLITAMTPTPEGEGKTTTAIGLSQALNLLGHSSILSLREPSLGPIFGMKGVGTGGGYSQVIPMEDINLHFTGDISAVTAANNLLSAMMDNMIYRDNPLKIDPNRILWKRCLDASDRELRHIVVGVGEETTGITRSEHFIISAASEIMAILCLSCDFADLKERLGSILVAFTFEGKPVYARDLKAHTAMAVLLHEAIDPNLVQTTEGTPAFVHGGPFANIAHGTSSLIATRMALKLSDIVVTEAGFGSDLGAEKFFDIASRVGNLPVRACVVVATLRALRYHGGSKRKDMATPNLELMELGIPNLMKHIRNIRKFGVEPVVALNLRSGDTEEEITALKGYLKSNGIRYAVVSAYLDGGMGTRELGEQVIELLDTEGEKCAEPIYSLDLPLEEKVRTIAREIYGLDHVVFTRKAQQKMHHLLPLGVETLPICIAKTQYSLSNNPKVRGIPESDDPCTITDISLSSGAGFVVVYTENINLMPGLPRRPRAEDLDIDEDGLIMGLG
jgi:formate--tetrahydrofolate ligase